MARDQDDPAPGAQQRAGVPDGFAQVPPDGVAHHRPADAPGGDKANPAAEIGSAAGAD